MTFTSITTYPRRLAHRRLAGRRARSRYNELRAVWLRKNRRRLVAVAIALIGIAVAGSAYDRITFGRFGFVSGVVWGATVTAWIALRNSPPGFVENWQQGAWGEEFTADELAQLPKVEWEPIHDLPDRGGNIDHVLLGPPGIFLLDSKKYAGSVQVDGDDLVVTNDLDTSKSYRDRGRLAAIRGQAARLNAEVRARSGRSPWVEPVIVIWGTFPARVHCGKGVIVVHGRELVGWLKNQPARNGNAIQFADYLRGGRHRSGRKVR